MAPRQALRVLLVKRGLAQSQAEAEALIKAGRVLVNGAIAMTGVFQVAPSDALTIAMQSRFVSRGGEKLQAAIDKFAINFSGACVLDAGSSTGGFTDCALQAGASHVTAIDVGEALLHERVANDPRVVVIERFNVRMLTEHDTLVPLRQTYDIVVADLSFISLTTVADALCSRVSATGSVVLLVKPQFEATKIEVSRGSGVITDPAIHQRTCASVTDCFAQRGLLARGLMASPLLGASGNTEFLLYLSRTC